MHVTDKTYQEHLVFIELKRYMKFYEQLAMAVFPFVTMGTKAIHNIDTYVYSSMQGTLESMKLILHGGRINDTYSLLRKFYDSAVINVYSGLYLRDNFNTESYIVQKINNWLLGKERLPEYRVMSQYIKSSKVLRPINDIFGIDNRYKLIRARCNDHTHYNFYRHAMLNDNKIYMNNRVKWLDIFSEDIHDLLIMHLGYVFFLNSHYMMSSDYLDALECGMQPNEDSQYWVAPFIQVFFDEVITPRRPDVTSAIRTNTLIQLS